MSEPPELRAAATDEDIRTAREMFTEYAGSLGVDLGFQQFDEEMAELPGKYAPPRGTILLAWSGALGVGCVAVRDLEWPRVAELKRLYVRPEARGWQLGERLSRAAIEFAQAAGYEAIRLDTLPTMGTAQQLYERLGFRDIEPYRFNPIEGSRYLELEISEYQPHR